MCIKITCGTITWDFSGKNDMLAEHFPNMPIVICESSYEYGVDCLPNLSNEPPNIKKARLAMYDDCVQSFSTVILIMTWGPLL